MDYILIVIIVLASFNLYFIKDLDSNLTQNYTNSIPKTGSIVDRTSKEVDTELQTKIVSWGEIIANNSNFSSVDNIISYPDDALVKVRDDNKIEFVVKRDTLEFSQEINELLSKYNVEIHEDISYFNASLIYLSIENFNKILSESRNILGISYIEPNFYSELDFVPNDEYYENDQWDLSLIGMESAWNYEVGSHDVIVAVIDTGIDYTHPDLSDNYLPIGFDWVNDDFDPMDDHFHGTHCTGIIAAEINNYIGIAGIADVSFFAEKAFNSLGSGSDVDCRAAIMHAVDMGADIISCSWGSTADSITISEGIDYAINNGVLVIAAAGNSDSNVPHYPAAYLDVIAVSATDQNDLKASFSSFGDWIDVSAPGVDIISTIPYDVKGAYYGSASGTSMAAPHVSGLAALLMSAFPSYNASQIETLIYDSALDLGASGFDQIFGYGRIDATNIFGPDTTPPMYSNLIESADPLILGNREVITIDISDYSGVNKVIIEFEESNHSMFSLGGVSYQYDLWTPSTTGIYPYTIYMADIFDNWNIVSDSVQVIEAESDIVPPTYSRLMESSDPLQLGETEIIEIKVTDPSGVKQVLIEINGLNFSMKKFDQNLWQYNWTPTSTGISLYTIYMEDNYNNSGSVMGSIQVNEADKTPPTYSSLIESADPLELGEKEIISINVYDPSGVKQVLIEFESTNHSMTKVGGYAWRYNSWIPTSTGNYLYTIYMEDCYNNSGSVSGSIEVKWDITPPECLNLTESADPLILGQNEIISIDLYDRSGIKTTLIKYEGEYHNFIYIGGNTWQHDSWTPTNTGIYPYTIYISDNCSNWLTLTDSIEVIESGPDLTPPAYSNLIESADPLELGNTEIISIDVIDPSGINQVLIEFEDSNHSMIKIGGDTWKYDLWTPSNTGIYTYKIYMEDNYNNWAFVSDSIEVIESGPDLIPPAYSNLIESADPLELGNTEIISIDVIDPSGINQVLIEFEGSNHSMIKISGDTWKYDLWTPSNTGVFPYTIHMEDNYNNWAFVSDSIAVKEDATPPSYSDLKESADPLELGETEVISIIIYDPSGIKQVLIEFDGSNHSMIDIGGNKWMFNSWIPKTSGIYLYTIYMMDNHNNMNMIINTIQVVDTTPPICTLLTNHTEPLELGNSTVILIKATDNSGIKQVLFQYEGINYLMRDIGGDVWQFKQFKPLNVGICNYKIYVEDNNNNWGLISSSVEVWDTQTPNPPELVSFPSGNVSNPIVFDWEDGNDPSGIKFYRLIIDTELNPFLTPGFIFEVNISNTNSESSYFELNESLSPETYFFFIYQVDGVGHQSLPATGKFNIISTNSKGLNTNDMENMIIFLVIIIFASVVGITGYMVLKKVKSEKKFQPLNKEFDMKNYNIKIKNLRKERMDLEREAGKLVKIGNYARASVLYEQCRNISNNLFKFGIITEAEKAKYYANKGSKIYQIQEQEINFIKTNINAFLTEYYNKLGINYYFNPEIYPENQNAVNGLILNDAKFLHQILLNPKKGFRVLEELNINLKTLTNYKAFQFIYTNDFSQQTISEYCVKFYNPEILLFIVSIKNVSKHELELLNSLIKKKDSNYGVSVKCISYESFGNILGINGKNRINFLKIFDFSKNFISDTIIYHHTEELKEILKEKKLYLFL